jgi:hypothetical protein
MCLLADRSWLGGQSGDGPMAEEVGGLLGVEWVAVQRCVDDYYHTSIVVVQTNLKHLGYAATGAMLHRVLPSPAVVLWPPTK